MTIEEVVILFLVVLIILQQGFYLWQIHRLLNKVMSKNYAEYSHVEKFKPPTNGFHIKLPTEDFGQDELADLNNSIRPPF